MNRPYIYVLLFWMCVGSSFTARACDSVYDARDYLHQSLQFRAHEFGLRMQELKQNIQEAEEDMREYIPQSLLKMRSTPAMSDILRNVNDIYNAQIDPLAYPDADITLRRIDGQALCRHINYIIKKITKIRNALCKKTLPPEAKFVIETRRMAVEASAQKLRTYLSHMQDVMYMLQNIDAFQGRIDDLGSRLVQKEREASRFYLNATGVSMLAAAAFCLGYVIHYIFSCVTCLRSVNDAHDANEAQEDEDHVASQEAYVGYHPDAYLKDEEICAE